jgi:hypothetical protein
MKKNRGVGGGVKKVLFYLFGCVEQTTKRKQTKKLLQFCGWWLCEKGRERDGERDDN